MALTIQLPETLGAWQTPAFAETAKREIAALGLAHLPLQQGLASSSVALEDNINVVILASQGTDQTLLLKAGVFYTGLLAGCGCADDPSPVPEQSEYCEIEVRIDRGSAAADINLLTD